MSMSMGGILTSFLMCTLAGCGTSAEDVVTSTTHCGGTLLGQNLLMRLSSYQPKSDSIPMWVIQACHPKGGCAPVITYRHSICRRFTRSGLMARSASRFLVVRSSRCIANRSRPVAQIGRWFSNTIRERRVATSLRASENGWDSRPGNSFRDTCDPALDVRPSAVG